MIFRPRNKKLDASDEILISGCKIEQVPTTKFLGVIIDCNLTWKYHVNYVCSKICKNIGILIKSRKIFNMDTLLTLYYSFIYPYLNYCVHLWGPTYASYINKVFLLQKKKQSKLFTVLTEGPTVNHCIAHFMSFPLVKCMCIILVLWYINITMVYCRIYLICLKKFQYSSVQYAVIKSVPCSMFHVVVPNWEKVFWVQSCHYMECNLWKHFCWYRNWYI